VRVRWRGEEEGKRETRLDASECKQRRRVNRPITELDLSGVAHPQFGGAAGALPRPPRALSLGAPPILAR